MKDNTYNLSLGECSLCKKQKSESKVKSWGSRGKKYHQKCLLSNLAYAKFTIKAIQENQNEKELPEIVRELMQEHYRSDNARVGFNGIINWLDEIIENVMWNRETMEG